MEAIEGWWRNVVGTNWFEMNVDRHIGTPVVNVNFDFKAPLTPRHAASSGSREALRSTRRVASRSSTAARSRGAHSRSVR